MTQVFLSYATEDNETPPGVEDKHGWVNYFERALRWEMRQRGGLNTEIWRDKRNLDRTAGLPDEIEKGLRGAIALVCVLSPNYVQKHWTIVELSRFIELQAAAGAGSELVFKVKKSDLEGHDEPDVLVDRIGFQFYERDEDNDDWRPFYNPGQLVHDKFWDELRGLVRRLLQKLAERAADDVAQAAPDRPVEETVGDIAHPDAPDGQFSVALAHFSADLAPEARAIRGELSDRGISTNPDENAAPPLTREDLDSGAVMLTAAGASLHMIGRGAGFTPDGCDAPILRLQLEAARAARVRRIIWAPPHIERDAAVIEILEDLRSGKTMDAADELIEEGFDALKGFLVTLLEDESPQARIRRKADLIRTIKEMNEADLAILRDMLFGGAPGAGEATR